MRLTAAIVVLAGCGRLGFEPVAGDVEPAVVTTSPLGGRWNHYADAADVSRPCDTSRPELRWSDCVHLGTYRELVLRSQRSCDALEITDALDALDWTCEPTEAGVRVWSKGLRPERGLRHLIDPQAWRPNRVTVAASGEIVAQTPLEPWWDDPIVPLPDNAGSAFVTELDQPDTVYVVSESRATAGYTIVADGVAIVALGGASLQTSARPTNCVVGMRSNPVCVIQATGRRHLWIEIGHESVDRSYPHVVAWHDVAMSEVRELRDVREADVDVWLGLSRGNRVGGVTTSRTTSAVELEGSTGNLVERIAQANSFASTVWLRAGADDNDIRDIWANHDDGSSVLIDASSRNRLSRLRIARAEGCPIDLTDAHDNHLSDVITLDSDGPALCARSSTGNVLTGFRIAGNGIDLHTGSSNNVISHGVIAGGHWDDPVHLVASPANTFAFLTIVNSGLGGIVIDGSDDVVVHGSLIANIAGDAVSITGSARFRITDLAVAHADGALVRLTNASDGVFAGSLVLGPGSCAVTGGAQPGLDATCAPADASTATPIAASGFASSLVGPITSDDGMNPADASGAAMLQFLTPQFPIAQFGELFEFDNPFRQWGRDAAFPSAAARGRCREVVGTGCRIWDHRLDETDVVLRNRAGGSQEHARPTTGAPCPGFVAGDATVTDRRAPARTFLRRAIEVDGNGDGLCESGEACVVAPSYGAYQGEGDLSSGCTFASGAVSDVKVLWWTATGARAASGARLPR